ncbi:MAG: alpha/beta hydrolase family protein [Methylovirgula sp.]
MLAARSPLHRAEAIIRPLLIGQGANDPRVKQAESDQLAAALEASKTPLTYVLYPDEGHGFARPTNSIAFWAITENFLATYLGGRAEPIGDAVAQSSAIVKAGADHVAGLQ